MHNTNVRLPKAPIVLPIIEMSKLSVGHDFANLNTRSCNYKLWNKASHKLAYRRFTYATDALLHRPTNTHHILSIAVFLYFIVYIINICVMSGYEFDMLANVCLSYLSKCALT